MAFGWGKGKEQNKKSFATKKKHLEASEITYQVPEWYSRIRYSEMLIAHSFTAKCLKTAVTPHPQLLIGNHFHKRLLLRFLRVHFSQLQSS